MTVGTAAAQPKPLHRSLHPVLPATGNENVLADDAE